jgi:hypothetical protein
MDKQIIKLKAVKTDKIAESSCMECVLNPYTCSFYCDQLNDKGMCKQDYHFEFASRIIGFSIVNDDEE